MVPFMKWAENSILTALKRTYMAQQSRKLSKHSTIFNFNHSETFGSECFDFLDYVVFRPFPLN